VLRLRLQHQVKALDIIEQFLPLRLTVQPSAHLQQQLPSRAYYYGVVSSAEYQSIVAKAKVRIMELNCTEVVPPITYRKGLVP